MFGSSEIRLSTAVMAHPRRREAALRLQRQYPEMGVQVVFDPDPHGPPATLRTARAAWGAVAEGATHHLVLQDDVVLCRDFPRMVTNALRVAPDGAVALFASWSMACAQGMRLAALVGASWTRVVDSWAPTQALVLPAEWSRAFAEYAADLPESRPDNRVMSTFLAQHGLDTYVAIPNLVEHAPARSLLLNDLLHGVREATVFAGDRIPVGPAFTDVVADPPALSYMWLGGGEFFSCYDPLDSGDRSMVTPTHEVLVQFGMSEQDLAQTFEYDRSQHPELAGRALVGDCFQFSMWLTMFASGVIAGALFEKPHVDALTVAFDQPWATAALATFPAAALRKMAPHESLHETAGHLTPFCRTALQSGLSALTDWPDLAALWEPRQFDIRPHWARS